MARKRGDVDLGSRFTVQHRHPALFCQSCKDVRRELKSYIHWILNKEVVVELNQCKINGKSFAWGLITRRSRHRPGTRYFSRGIDAQGHVSNFVETEQIVLYDGASTSQHVVGEVELSFVQTRGSIPVYWAQVINLKYTPRLWIGETRKSVGVHVCVITESHSYT